MNSVITINIPNWFLMVVAFFLIGNIFVDFLNTFLRKRALKLVAKIDNILDRKKGLSIILGKKDK